MSDKTLEAIQKREEKTREANAKREEKAARRSTRTTVKEDKS